MAQQAQAQQAQTQQAQAQQAQQVQNVCSKDVLRMSALHGMHVKQPALS